MFIQNVYIQNFLSFREATFDFTDFAGITLIEGANGVGKSAILDAITWCLFGKLLRPAKQSKANDVRYRFDLGERTLVVVTLQLDEGEPLVVERSRSRNGPDFRISRVTGESTTAGLQEQLESMIGMNYRTFVSSLMFGGSVSSFCAMTDAERKQVLEEMLEIDYFLAARDVAAARARELEAAQANLHLTISTEKDKRLEYDDMLKEAFSRQENHEAVRQEELRRLMDESSDSSDTLEEATDKLQVERKGYQQTVDTYDEAFAKWAKARDLATDIWEKDNTTWSCLGQEVATARSRFKSANDELKSVRAAKQPDVCPTCGQRWPQKGGEALANLTKQHEQTVDKWGAEVARLQKDIEKARPAHETAQKGLDQVDVDEPESPPDRDLYIAPHKSTLEAARTVHKAALDTLKAFRANTDNPYAAQIKSLEKSIVECQQREDKAGDEVEEVTLDLYLAKYWMEGFGRKGLPSFLIDSAVPTLNQAATEISRILTNGELYVSFDPSATKGSTSVLGVEVEFNDGGDNYDMTSRGEHCRVDLTVLFALRELVASRRECRQVFIDEVFDGLDADGLEAVIRLLRSRYGDAQIFVISHDQEMKGFVDQVVSIEKDGHTSQIVA